MAQQISREEYLSRPLPSSPDAERCINGAILLDNELIGQAIEKGLMPEDYYSPNQKTIYKAMLHLYERGERIDPIILGEEIKKGYSLDSIGGVATITNLTYGLPIFSDIYDYIKIVKDKSTARQFVKTCSALTDEALSEEKDIREIIEAAEQKIFDLRPNTDKKGFSHAADIINSVLEKIVENSQRAKDAHTLSGLSTGFRDLNDKLSGLVKGDLIIIGGRPSQGKSALMVDLALNATDDDKDAVVAIFSLEVSKAKMGLRMVSQRAVVDSQRLKQNFLVGDERSKVNFALAEIAKKRLHIEDEKGLSALDIRARARQLLVSEKRLDLIIVDHADLIYHPDSRREKRHQLSDIVKSLKDTAGMLDVPVILISPVSRKCEARKPPKPIMSDLAESSALEFNADVVMFIYREDYYKDANAPKTGIAEIIVAKNRDNPTGTVKLAWLDFATTFRNLAD